MLTWIFDWPAIPFGCFSTVAKWLNKELDIPVLNEVQEKRMIDAILNVMVRIIKKTFGYNENK